MSLGGAGSAKADITYSIANYPADQNGASLSGTIVTDGATGSLSASDILSWSWTITPAGGTPFTFSSSDAGAAVAISGTVIASQTAITIGASSGPSNDFALYNSTTLVADLEYDRDTGEDGYFGANSAGQVWATTEPMMGGQDPWVIASNAVPEPGTLTMLGIAVVLVGASSRHVLRSWLAKRVDA
jgi:hypothetical protein